MGKLCILSTALPMGSQELGQSELVGEKLGEDLCDRLESDWRGKAAPELAEARGLRGVER